MRILLVSNGFPPKGRWGTEFYTYQLARGLAQRGHCVRVLCPGLESDSGAHHLEVETHYGIEVAVLRRARDPSKSFARSYSDRAVEALFTDLLAEWAPAVVHFVHLGYGLSLYLPKLLGEGGIPSLLTLTDFGLLCHRGQLLDWRFQECSGLVDAQTCARCIREPSIYDSSPVRRTLKRVAAHSLAKLGGCGRVVTGKQVAERSAAARSALDHVDRILAPTEAMRARFRAAGVAEERMVHLPYALDEEPYRRDPALPSAGLVRFAFLGQFMPHKGLHLLFAAVRILAARPDLEGRWRVELHGDRVPGRHGDYLAAIWSSDLEAHVERRGTYPPLEAPRVLSEIDVLLLPSQWSENAPLTLSQAQAVGLPIIASDVPGVREVLGQDPRAQLIARDDSQAWADAMERCIEHLPERQLPPPSDAYGRHITQVEEHYRELIEARTGPVAARSKPALAPVSPSAESCEL